MSAPPALQLALDSSASRPCAAVLEKDRVLSEWSGPPGLQHHETLLAGVDRCLHEAGVALADIHFLSVGVGPGLFTGLRIGVITAKFLADPLGIPCVPVSSLLALGLQSGHDGSRRSWMLGDARSRRVYALLLKEPVGDFTPPEEESLALPPEEAALRMLPGDLLAGEGALLYRELWPAGTELLPERFHTLRAAPVGRIGYRQYSLGLGGSATELEPKYLRTGQAHL